MQYLARWTRKFIGQFFPKPKFAPLLPNNLNIAAKKTLCFCAIPSQTAHLELFDINIEPIREIKIFKLNDDLTKKYLNQKLINFTEKIQDLLNQKCAGLQSLFSENNDFDTFKSNFYHQLKFQSVFDSQMSLCDDQNIDCDIRFDSTHSSIIVFSRKPSFISSSYQEVDSNHKNDISIHSEYQYSGEFTDPNFFNQDEQQFLDNNNRVQQQITPRL